MAVNATAELVLAKYRGCMIGGLLGDCIGEPFEVEISDAPGHSIILGSIAGEIKGTSAKTVLQNFFTTLLDDSLKAGPRETLCHTDDTAMMISVAKSLVEKGAYDPNDMAKKFVDEYYLHPGKGYGSGVVHVFHALKKSGFQNVFEPAELQFGGTGSYGNGAAMRVAPVALFGYRNEDLIKEIAGNSSLITHTHQHGYNGAILQALAVHQALLADASHDVDPVYFVDALLKKMEKIEKEVKHIGSLEDRKPYCGSLTRMKKIFEEHPLGISAVEVAKIFGNHVTAQKSVPAAIFSFLQGFQPLKDFETSNPFVRTLYFAVAVGGDTDTIACMAGSIAGAYYGESVIPASLMKKCEDGVVEELRNLGDQLFQINQRSI